MAGAWQGPARRAPGAPQARCGSGEPGQDSSRETGDLASAGEVVLVIATGRIWHLPLGSRVDFSEPEARQASTERVSAGSQATSQEGKGRGPARGLEVVPADVGDVVGLHRYHHIGPIDVAHS